MPRLACNVFAGVVARSVAPLITIWPGVAAPGTAPKFKSLLIEIVPPLIVVMPPYEFVPLRVAMPAPCFVRFPLPEIGLARARQLNN